MKPFLVHLVSLQMFQYQDILLVQLNKLNNVINGHDSWSLINTCSYFAGYVWCQTFDDKVNVGIAPSFLATSNMNNSYVTDRSFPAKSRNSIYYHTSTDLTNCPYPAGGGSSGSRTIDGEVTSFTVEELE